MDNQKEKNIGMGNRLIAAFFCVFGASVQPLSPSAFVFENGCRRIFFARHSHFSPY